MKNVVLSFFTLLFIIFISSCSPETLISLDESTQNKQVDTVIMFDPVTFEQTISIVTTKDNNRNAAATGLSKVDYQIDTVITFDPDTYEETIRVVKTKIISKDKKQKN